MKLKRKDAILAHNGLMSLEKGVNGKNFEFDFPTWDKLFAMMTCLSPVVEAHQKARQKRFMAKSNSGKIEDPKSQMDLQLEEEKQLEEVISVKMPKKLLTEAELKLSSNKIPPSIRLMLLPLVVDTVVVEMDDDDNNYEVEHELESSKQPEPFAPPDKRSFSKPRQI